MSGSIVADTSLLVNFFNGVKTSREVLKGQQIWISCITEIELLSYSHLSEKEESLIRSFLDNCYIIELYADIRRLTIDIRKKQKLKVPDAIIAATTKYTGFPLITMDSDFRNIPDIDVIILET